MNIRPIRRIKTYFLFLIALCLVTSCDETPDEEITMADVIIIGGGLMGSSVAWQLANSGQRVLLLEIQDSIYTTGSSQGESRLVKSLAPQDNLFSFLHNQSIEETGKLIDFLNSQSKDAGHSLDDIYTTSTVNSVFQKEQEGFILSLSNSAQPPYEFALNGTDANLRWETNFPNDMLLTRESSKYSGVLNPKALIEKLHMGIKARGSLIIYNTEVTDVLRDSSVYMLGFTNTKSGEEGFLFSKKIVSAIGPYTGILLYDIAPYLEDLVITRRSPVAYIQPTEAAYRGLTDSDKQKLYSFFPVEFEYGEEYYGMIEGQNISSIPTIKCGSRIPGDVVVNIDSVWNVDLTADEIDWSLQNTLFYINALGIPWTVNDLNYTGGYSCVVSSSESEIPYITNIVEAELQRDKDFTVMTGFSGRGADGALAYGLIASHLVREKVNQPPKLKKAASQMGYERFIVDLKDLLHRLHPDGDY